jgi:hypothetical protein
MSIPLPGAGVVYSALKDVWNWGSTRFRGRRFGLDVFRGWTVDQWYDLEDAVWEFGTDWPLRRREDDEREIHAELIRGELIARGFRVPFSPGAPYLTISRQEWRVLNLLYPNHAVDGSSNYAYVGVTIGKPGTKRFLRQRARSRSLRDAGC